MFSITLSDLGRSRRLAKGLIVIDEFRESFEASLTYWSVHDYEVHWGEAIKRLLDGRSRSCLITSLYNPRLSGRESQNGRSP